MLSEVSVRDAPIPRFAAIANRHMARTTTFVDMDRGIDGQNVEVRVTMRCLNIDDIDLEVTLWTVSSVH